MKYSIVLGLLFIFSVSNKISAQEISMFPGFWKVKYYEDDNQISKQQVADLMTADAKANELWQKSKTRNTIAWIALGAEVGFFAWALSGGNNNDVRTAPLIGGLGSAAVAIGFGLSASKLQKDAILQYNKSKDTGSILLGPTRNGVGLVLNF